MKVVICPPTMDWSWMTQRPQQLMKQFARNGYTVFYCNKTLRNKPLEEVETNLYVVHDHDTWLKLDWPGWHRQAKGSIGVWCALPLLAKGLYQYQADWIIYDCADEFVQWLPYEADMVNVSKAVVCSSEPLYQRIRREYPDKPAVVIRNGYDPDMGLHLPMEEELPEDLRPFADRKLIGYIGAWAPWVDANLVDRASLIEHAELIVIGPEFGRRFLAHKNSRIRFLGLKPHHELARYLRQFSLCVIPFRLTSVTLAVNPVKAYEYLAAGKPVVTTNLPECKQMEPFVDAAADSKQFLDLIQERLLHPGAPRPRTDYSLAHTWSHRFQQIQDFIRAIR